MSASPLRRLWRLLPQKLRQQIQFQLSRMVAARVDNTAKGGLPIGIAGLFRTASGIGEGARLTYAALEAANMQPSGFDLSPAFGQSELPPRQDLRPLVPGSAGSIIIHHNAPYLPYALWALGRSQVRGRRIIGYWAWELPQLPASWLGGFRFVHEIWVPSSFTRSAVAAATSLPVHVVPHPLPAISYTPGMRAAFGLPEQATIVLNVFHLGSAFTRKNPIAAILAFRRAFGDAFDRLLVLKIVDSGTSPWARKLITKAVEGAPNIRLIEGALSPADMAGLTAAADIVISLHRSEGFGLVPAEAMQQGKPVIATAWSGNLDFMNEKNSALISYKLVPVQDPDSAFTVSDQAWAEADIDHAAEWLRRLAESVELRQRLGAAAAADVARLLSPERIVSRMRGLLGSN